MIPPATMAMKLVQIIAFFLIEEHITASLFKATGPNAALSRFYSPSQRAGDQFHTESTKESPDSIHGNNEGPDDRDGPWGWRLVVPVEPAAIDEALNVLQRKSTFCNLIK